jgi:drug/metabolite transporter (DMT)-like permease
LPGFILVALVLGFFAYGLSIFFYVKAQRVLGAAGQALITLPHLSSVWACHC